MNFSGNLYYVIGLVGLLIIPGCQSEKPLDTKAVKKEMASRELRKISNTQITEAADQLGKLYFQASEEEKQNLNDSLELNVQFIATSKMMDASEKMLVDAYKDLLKEDVLNNLYVDAENRLVSVYGPKYDQGILVGLIRLEITKKKIINSL